jgi:hypothetical protein
VTDPWGAACPRYAMTLAQHPPRAGDRVDVGCASFPTTFELAGLQPPVGATASTAATYRGEGWSRCLRLGMQRARSRAMFVASTHGQRKTPLPHVAAHAARQALAAARPHTVPIAQAAARILLTAAIMTGLARLFALLIAQSLR